MRDLWGYNARRDDFQRGIENVVHRTVFHTSRALVCPLNSIFFYRHYPLMSLERHQLGLRELHEIELCAGSGLDPRPEAKHRASDSPIQGSCMGIGQTNLFACRRLLCSASRTSRDTPQSSIVWTIIPLIPTFPHSPGVAMRAVSAGAGAPPVVRPWQCMQATWKEAT